MSYPAREYAGRIINDGIGLGEDSDWLLDIATEEYILTDSDEASRLLPKRAENSNKGSFGKLSVIAGSAEYGGAPLLALGGALRSGVGYVTFFGEESSRSQVLCKYPEVIFKERPSFENMTDADIEKILSETQNSSAVLIGSGCGRSAGLLSLVYAFLASSGAPLVLDADAINMLGSDRENALRAINESPRVLIFTPHPLEFARLFGKEISEVQNRRLTLAKEFSLNTGGAILTLKGAATIVTNGKRTYINSSGSSALAKAGSGDVLAGIVASLIASSSGAELDLCALGVYAHGRAGDMLSGIYSTLGVTPSDLPEAAAVALAELEQNKAP